MNNNILKIAKEIKATCTINMYCSQCELNELSCGEFDLDFTTCSINELVIAIDDILKGKDYKQIEILNNIVAGER